MLKHALRRDSVKKVTTLVYDDCSSRVATPNEIEYAACRDAFFGPIGSVELGYLSAEEADRSNMMSDIASCIRFLYFMIPGARDLSGDKYNPGWRGQYKQMKPGSMFERCRHIVGPLGGPLRRCTLANGHSEEAHALGGD